MAGGYKETEKLIDELMNMKIPQYTPSSNHVQLSVKGLILFFLPEMPLQNETPLSVAQCFKL